MRYFKQSIRVTPNKNYAAAPMFKGRSSMDFDGQKVTMAMRSKTEMYAVKEYKDGMPTFNHTFDGLTPMMINFKWEIDPQTNKVVESANQKREAEVLRFLKYHENVVWRNDIDKQGNVVRKPKNSNLKTPIFIIEVLEDTLENEITKWEKELKVRSIISGMTEEQRVELCYFYGLNPSTMIDGESKISLAGSGGTILQKDNIDDFLAMMDNKSSELHGVFDKVLFTKSLMEGVIKHVDGVFTSEGGVQLGFSEAEAINYIQTNTGFKDMLCKRVNQNRVTFNKSIKREHTAIIEEGESNVLNLTYDEKIKWARENKVPHIHTMKDETKIDDAIRKHIVGKGIMATEKENS